MIVSENIDAATKSFVPVLDKSVAFLRNEARVDARKYLMSSGTKLEGLILDALNFAAKGTEFEGSIRLASGLKFPDIVLEAGGLGVEVKSTTQNHWITVGNSVLESTRIPNIEKIFLMFGKLAEPVDFRVRPYEECLKEVLVTHYPRYQIDMELAEGDTIFDKIGKSYEEIRTLPEPVDPMIEYYSSKLKPGESLWWSGRRGVHEQSSPMTVRELSSLNPFEVNEIVTKSFVLFPQLFGRRQDKFHDLLMWLLRKGLICGNIRDYFTAGGRWHLRSSKGRDVSLPQVVKRFYMCKARFLKVLDEIHVDELQRAWGINVLQSASRFSLWKNLVRQYVENRDVWESIFEIVGQSDEVCSVVDSDFAFEKNDFYSTSIAAYESQKRYDP